MAVLTFAGETPLYRTARDRLLAREVALRRETEAVAAQRRALPPGPPVAEDHVFEGLDAAGRPARIALSAMFRPGSDALLVYCYMFPRHREDTREAARSGETASLPRSEQPCPSCTALLDQLDRAALHFEAGGGSFAVVAAASLDRLLAVGRDRGWQHLRLYSSAGNGFKRAYGAEDAEGQQVPMTLAFRRDADGTIRLFWASELVHAPADPGQDHRAAGTIEPFWNMFDLLPAGRPDFDEQMQYGCCEPPRPPEEKRR